MTDVHITDETAALLRQLQEHPASGADTRRALGLPSSNMHTLLGRLHERGYLGYTEVDPEDRRGLRRGEMQKVWHVEPLGRMALSLHTAVNHALHSGASVNTAPER